MADSFNPEIQKTLDTLADLIWDDLNGDPETLAEREDELLEALLRDGFARESKKKLGLVLEERVVDRHYEKAIHRRAEIARRVKPLQDAFEELVRWKANLPREQ